MTASHSYDPTLYASWCDAAWADAPWLVHDEAPPEPEPDAGPLDFSAGDEATIRFDSQAHWLQSCLKRLVAPELVVDGAPGNRTRVATKEFQRRVREFVPDAPALTADGVAGPATIAALEAATLTWAPDHGAAAAPVQFGAVSVTALRGGPGRVRVAADGGAIDLSFETRGRRDRGGRALADPHNFTALTPQPEVAALQELGLDPGDAAVLRATCLGGPGSVDTTGPELVALGLGFGGRGGGIAALLAALKEDADAREIHERLLAPQGLDVEFGPHRRLDPATGATVEREGFELVLTDAGESLRGDAAWAAVRARPHLLGALALAAAAPQAARVQVQLWQESVRDRLLRGAVAGGLALEHVFRCDLGVACALLLARRGYQTLRTWLDDQLSALAARFPGAPVRDPAAWESEPGLAAALLDAALARLTAGERARLAGLARGRAPAGTTGPAAVAGPARQPPPGDGYVERRVKVSAYGTLPANSPLLVPVPAASPGPKRLHRIAAAALARMAEAVERDLGIDLKIASAWRAHRWTSREQYEQVLVQRFGSVSEGRRWLAFDSPHETGLAIDIGVGGLKPSRASAESQKRQPLHRWLIAHAWEYGWYPYKTEPWHWEYPMSLQAFQTGELGPDAPGAPADALSFSVGDDEDDALEDTDLDELPS